MLPQSLTTSRYFMSIKDDIHLILWRCFRNL